MSESQPQPTPYPYYPPPPPPHSHDKYVALIAALGLIVLLIGAGLALTGVSVSSLQSRTSTLSDDNSQLTTQNQQLQSEVSSLESELSQLQAAKLRGDFWWFADCPSFSICSYIINGAYTNMGTRTPNSARIVFTVYSGPEGTGQILCTTTYVLGSVPGRTIEAITEVECSGTTSLPGDTMGWR